MISKRLKAIAELINDNESVVDIGCDHGYLALSLRQNGNKSPVICCDNKIGPLNNARKNLTEYENIEFVLSDGAEAVERQCSVAVMAGMGANTVKQIMSNSIDYFRNTDRIIIQVNNDQPVIRRWLNENNFSIIDEKVVKDHKYYEIIIAKDGSQILDETQIKYGPVLMKEKSPMFIEYVNDRIMKKEKILQQIDRNNLDYQAMDNEIMELVDLVREVSDN